MLSTDTATSNALFFQFNVSVGRRMASLHESKINLFRVVYKCDSACCCHGSSEFVESERLVRFSPNSLIYLSCFDTRDHGSFM